MKKLLVGVGLATLSAAPLQAASSLDAYLGNPGDCYARRYDEAHLKSHPRQMVERIYLAHDESYQDPNGELTLRFGFTLRNGRDYQGVAICDGMSCGVEGDGGAFKLSTTEKGLRLDVDKRRGMSAEGSFDFVDLSETDDTVFLLFPAKSSACQ